MVSRTTLVAIPTVICVLSCLFSVIVCGYKYFSKDTNAQGPKKFMGIPLLYYGIGMLVSFVLSCVGAIVMYRLRSTGAAIQTERVMPSAEEMNARKYDSYESDLTPDDSGFDALNGQSYNGKA